MLNKRWIHACYNRQLTKLSSSKYGYVCCHSRCIIVFRLSLPAYRGRPLVGEDELMIKIILLTVAFVIGLTTAIESAPRRKRAEPNPAQKQVVQEQDEFRSCDVAVREFVQGRKEAAALPVNGVKADGLRMTLNFVHPHGESGDTPPNLAFTRGESIEERRKALNEAKKRIRMLEEAAKVGNVWYVVALNKDNPNDPDVKRNPTSIQSGDSRPSVSSVVFADIKNRCVTVYESASSSLETLSQELRAILEGRVSPQAETSAVSPPS